MNDRTSAHAAGAAAASGAHFQQLYYTSCEHGLSGFSGFQFNAVSEGVTAGTRQAVEALAGYEPPRSLVESDTPEQLDRCPVNLCYRPYDQRGRTATALCVRYVGRDSARRFGNYFAHALHSEDFPAAGRGLLGIELWNSPVWRGQVSPSTEIPLLAAPPRGPLTARGVQEFLTAHPHTAQLPQLLAAVLAALTEHGSVVVTDHTTERIAHWFAAVCYLLPPPLARRLSFATYVLRPARSRLHLIGTVPEAQLDFGADEEEAYTVFDFARGRFPRPAATPETVRALVDLLTRIGVGSVRPVWTWAAEFTHGAEERPEDWYAPVAAAAASGGIALTGAEARALTRWLPGADHLGSRRAQVAAELYRGHRQLDDAHLTVLSGVAHAAGDTALHQEIEGRLYESRMRAHMSAAEDAVAPTPITDRDARRQATALWERLLATGTTDTRQRARLLLWALGADLAPAPEVLDRETLALARALLATPAPGAELLREVEWLAGELPPVRAALATAVEEALESRAGQEQLFTQFPAALLTERDLTGRPLLLEHYWRARVEREPERTAEMLLRILHLRGQAVPDAELLCELWRHPSRTWTHLEAIEIVRALPVEVLRDEEVGQWLDRAANQPIDGEEQLDLCLRLYGLLSNPDRLAVLRLDTRRRVSTTLALERGLREAREATELARVFTVQDAGLWAGPQALKRYRLIPVLLQLPADVGRLRDAIPDFGHALLERYLAQVRQLVETGERIDEVRLSHIAAVAAVRSGAGMTQAHYEVVNAVRQHTAHHWPLAELERLERAVRPCHAELADRYREIAESRRGPRRAARLLPALWPVRRRREEKREPAESGEE
ncbi:GTPase-associated protein 1-related protein [Kitasatospora sp. NPDC058190]|uniref:GTPase-associated protein 1-related protein n=1 Tax=Kitasatospora sp. NPDC058190 TaxID=3346371 RepID=UPI0036D78A74